ncbi:hypothetical protein, partial [Aquiflexum sp.]|uniref:hypothetical protein n=1 Tax=Aquiflexum sp. TaxID=1872584 RepID=UPI003593B2E0
MTAVVGILNKQAVALAADSAVTIGGTNGRKILNKANKVFSLSNVHPIGIMIYNSASFMATPWETIINVYRKQLGKTSFSSLKEYQSNFIEFIRGKNFYTDSEMQLVYLKGFALDVINSVIQEILKDNHRIIEKPDDESRNLFLDLVNTQLEKLLQRWKGEYEKCNEFDDYTFEMFQTYSNSIFAEINQERFIYNEINISSELLVKIKEVVYYILIAKEDLSNFTGLIFSGFGEQEIYPQLISINISMVIDNRLRYYINGDQCASISNENNGAICPFAQTDVINTILSGIDPSLDETYLANF